MWSNSAGKGINEATEDVTEQPVMDALLHVTQWGPEHFTSKVRTLLQCENTFTSPPSFKGGFKIWFEGWG